PDSALASLSEQQPLIGDEVFNIGSPLGVEHIASFGRVSDPDLRATPIGLRFYVDFPAAPGMSGSALFNNNGKIVGLLEAHEPDTSLAIFIHLSTIKKFLEGII